MRYRLAASVIAITALLTLALAQADKLSVGLDPMWQGDASGSGVYPIRVFVGNVGKATAGELIVARDGFEMHYPVELPTDAEKTIDVYVPMDYGYEPIQFSLRTGEGAFAIEHDPSSYAFGNGLDIGLVSNTPGLQFLEREGDWDANTAVNVLQSRFDRVPDRQPGYSQLEVVVLGEGSELLSDASVDALQRYILGGGIVVVVGGASAPILSDPRWQSLLPLEGFRRETLEGSAYLSEFSGSPVPRFTVTTGSPKPATVVKGQPPLIASSRHGLGSIVYLAFNPLEGDLSRWDGLEPLLMSVFEEANPESAAQWKATQTGHQGFDPQLTMSGLPPPGETPTNDPFEVELPSSGLILVILLCYAVIVVPANFLVLRALKRVPWAWLTAPLIAVAAAGVIFSLSRGLYSAETARSVKGVLIVDEAIPSGHIEANQEIFFPHAGRQDLGLFDIEAVGAPEQSFGMFGANNSRSSFHADMYDVGTVIAPAAATRNLDFRRLELYQKATNPPRFSFEGEVVTEEGDAIRIRGTVRNLSSYRLENAVLTASGKSISVGVVEPDGEASVDGIADTPVSALLESVLGGGLALTGDIKAYPVGSQVGDLVPTRDGVTLLHTFRVDLP